MEGVQRRRTRHGLQVVDRVPEGSIRTLVEAANCLKSKETWPAERTERKEGGSTTLRYVQSVASAASKSPQNPQVVITFTVDDRTYTYLRGREATGSGMVANAARIDALEGPDGQRIRVSFYGTEPDRESIRFTPSDREDPSIVEPQKAGDGTVLLRLFTRLAQESIGSRSQSFQLSLEAPRGSAHPPAGSSRRDTYGGRDTSDGRYGERSGYGGSYGGRGYGGESRTYGGGGYGRSGGSGSYIDWD